VKFEKKIPSTVIKRMPRYYRYLSTLMKMGISRVSSKDLGNRMGITPSQVRQDFFTFGGNGLQGYGYDVKFLHEEIRNILGLGVLQHMIIIGAGSLGHALAKHTSFEKRGFKIAGIFDVKSQLLGEKINDIEIMHLDSLPEFIEKNHIDIAAITVPEGFANEVAELATKLGIKALWNFAPVELKVPDDVVVEDIHLIDSLMILGYNAKESKAGREK
jgi:redox-sensing transcriptional repressor